MSKMHKSSIKMFLSTILYIDFTLDIGFVIWVAFMLCMMYHDCLYSLFLSVELTFIVL